MGRLHREAPLIPLYTGFDPREEAGTHVFHSSVIHTSSEPVALIPLDLKMLGEVYQGGQRDGSNAFIYSRFLIPYLQNYEGFAIFADGADMLCRGDIAELWAMRDPYKAVQVVKHEYKTKHPRKYIGTQMEAKNEDYPCKNWSSLMLINCQHYGWREINPGTIEDSIGAYLHRFQFLEPRFVGSLPWAWNWLDEYGENPDAKIIHWTNGTPAFKHYQNAPHAKEFADQLCKVTHVTS